MYAIRSYYEINGVAKRVKAEAGNGYNNGHVAQKGPYDLILANILARPLVKMARDLEKNLAQDGVAVLSGLLNRQEQWVINAHRTVGLVITSYSIHYTKLYDKAEIAKTGFDKIYRLYEGFTYKFYSKEKHFNKNWFWVVPSYNFV